MLLAPVVHQLEHAIAHERALSRVEAQPDHVHTDFAAFSRALEDSGHASFLCSICSTTLQTVQPASNSMVRMLEAEVDPVVRATLIPALHSSFRPIRAPPIAG